MAQHKSSTSNQVRLVRRNTQIAKCEGFISLQLPLNHSGVFDEHNQDDFWSRKSNRLDQFKKKAPFSKKEGRGGEGGCLEISDWKAASSKGVRERNEE